MSFYSPILNKSYDLSHLSRNLDIVRLSYDDLTMCYDKICRKTFQIHKACRSISYDNFTIGWSYDIVSASANQRFCNKALTFVNKADDRCK